MKDEQPKVQSLILADQVYVDAKTGKKIIAGTFNRMLATEFHPGKTFERAIWAFVCITGLDGEHKVKLIYKDLKNDQTLMETSEIVVVSKDPLASLELIMQVPPLPMPHAGVYVFEVAIDGESTGSLRIAVDTPNKGTD